jgi:hypothetical protein
MVNRYYQLTMYSNNTDIEINERLEVIDLTAAINLAKTTLVAVKAIAGMPTDIRIKRLSFIGEVPVAP